MRQRGQALNADGDVAGPHAVAPVEETIFVVRNDLTVIRGEAQLMERALRGRTSLDAGAAQERLAAIITSVDEASLELQHLQSSARSHRQRL